MIANVKEQVKSHIGTEGEEDFIGLWEIVRSLRDQLPGADAETVREAVLQVVDELLATGEWETGFPTKDGRQFIAWNLPADAAVGRTRREWEELGREPNIGEIVWLNRR